MKRIPPFRNRRDVFYLVHEEPTKDSENGIYIVKPKDNSYRAIWAVVWDVPLKLMSTSDGYTKEEVDKIISTIKDYQKENDKLLENIKLEISKLNSKKADRTELANVVAGLVPMGSVANLTKLEAKPKRNNDAYYVEDQLSPEGNAYIYRWDAGLNLWVNTKQVVFKYVITQGLGDSSNKVMSQKAVTDELSKLAGEDTASRFINMSPIGTTIINGKAVNWDSSIIHNEDYCIIKDINLKKNDFVKVSSAGSAYIIINLQETVGGEVIYTPVRSVGSKSDPSLVDEHYYFAEENCTIAISGRRTSLVIEKISDILHLNIITRLGDTTNLGGSLKANEIGYGEKIDLLYYRTNSNTVNKSSVPRSLTLEYNDILYRRIPPVIDEGKDITTIPKLFPYYGDVTILGIEKNLLDDTIKYGITDGGVIAINPLYSRTEPYLVKKGKTVKVIAAGTGFAPISSYDVDGDTYHPLVADTNNDEYEKRAYYYTPEEDMWIVASGRTEGLVANIWSETASIIGGNAVDDTPTELIIDNEPTDYVATARNYILKEVNREDVNYLMFSNDLGNTWTESVNTLGDISFIHWFSNGTCLVCTPTKVYTTKDFTSFEESTVYDFDGSVFVPNARHFYRLGNYNSEYCEVNGVETVFWNDYGGGYGYLSRVWMSEDNGQTIKCICKMSETTSVDGTLIVVTHFHRTWWDNKLKCLWITSGDSGTYCKLIKGTLVDDAWEFEIIGMQDKYKFGQFHTDGLYAYALTDYTNRIGHTGIIKCPVDGLDNPDNFEYLFNTNNFAPVSAYYEDGNGNKVIFPDGVGYNKCWIATEGLNFKEASVLFKGNKVSPMAHIGPNYNGESIIRAQPGYDISDMKLNGPRYTFAQAVRKGGIKNFGFGEKLMNI